MDEVERAYSTLNLYGVPVERAGSIANGIEVLVTRFRKEISCLKVEIASFEAQIEEMNE